MNSLPKQILFVSNDDRCFESVNRKLNYEEESYALTPALTADQALFLMTDETFDLYILDSLLKDTSSVELCRRLREKDRETPNLFFRGDEQQLAKAQIALKPESHEFLDKSNDLDRLAETVKKILM